MLKGRRVGTLTAGLVLIVFGLLFLAKLVFLHINYLVILSLWPIILVFLGAEVIISYVLNKEDKLRYDGWAIALVIVLSFFAMFMAGSEFIINYLHQHNQSFRIY